jgi:stearoyl-CoA desaturase (delta-9 desaturase)
VDASADPVADARGVRGAAGVAAPSAEEPFLPVARRTFRQRWPHLAIGFAFWGIHLAALGLLVHHGWSWSGAAVTAGLYVFGMFFVTAGYHRYFSHRTFKTSRWFQFVLAFGAQLTAQKGVLWWASHHRRHHKYSDQPQDVHSAKQRGFWWSHAGWILSSDHEVTEWARIQDFARFPELRFLNAVSIAPAVLVAVIAGFVGGTHGLLWGAFVPVVLLWHGTFTINSLTHLWGRRRYDSGDESRNNWLLAIITLGEGWHNNHHYYQSSVNQGFYWYEYDVTYYILRAMEKLGLVWDLRTPPRDVLELGRRPLTLPKPTLAAPPGASATGDRLAA